MGDVHTVRCLDVADLRNLHPFIVRAAAQPRNLSTMDQITCQFLSRSHTVGYSNQWVCRRLSQTACRGLFAVTIGRVHL